MVDWKAEYHRANKDAFRIANERDAALTEATHLRAELDKARTREEILRAAISWIEPPFIDKDTPADELRQRIGFCVADATRAFLASAEKEAGRG